MKKIVVFSVVLLFCALAHGQGPSYPYSVINTWTLSSTASSLVAGQNVYRASWSGTACGPWSKLTTTLLGNAVTSYTDTSMANGNSYCYGVTAVGTNGAESAIDSFDPVNVPPAPPTAETATVSQNGREEAVTVAWTQSITPGIIHNKIYAGSKSGGPYKLQATIPAVTQVTDENAPAGTWYVVTTAVGVSGESGPSNEAKVIVP